MNILIQNGRVIDPATRFDQIADIGVSDGAIVFVGAAPSGFVADETIDATGLSVCPGLVDLSARLGEPGGESRDAMRVELSAAAAGGVTSLVCPPDTDPPLDEPGVGRMLRHRAQLLKGPRVYPLGALTVQLGGEMLTEMGELSEAGCVGFSQGERSLADTLILMRAVNYASTFDMPVWLRPQEPFLAKSGVAHDGEFATLRGLAPIPAAAEVIALFAHLEVARETGARLHVQQISSKASIELIRQAKAEGLPVTCDASIHHLHLCDEDIGYYDSNCLVFPPFRAREDRAALRAALAEGVIDVACSDHDPVDVDAKQRPFATAEPGVSAVELLLPLTLLWAKETGLPLCDALACVTHRPAAILGIEAGRLAPGRKADLCLFDPNQTWTPSASTLLSFGKNTPFVGRSVTGRVVRTIIDGVSVYAREAV